MRLPTTLSLTVASAVLVVMPTAPATAEGACPVVPYPGDVAPKPAIAAWMAGGAAARGVPGELPVMAALVESNLTNLPDGDADAKGYFQMRESIWSASYPGYPSDPDLQLDWFLDQATTVRTPPYPPETGWGEWAADVQRPAAQNRGKYQPRLADARGLIGTCGPLDTTAPPTQVTVRSRQKALRARAVAVSVACPTEPCTVDVRARIRVGAQREMVGVPATLAAGQAATFAVRLKPAVRRLVARALGLRRKVRADVTVTTTDIAGNASSSSRRVRITG